MSAKSIYLIFFISILVIAEVHAQDETWDRTVYRDSRYRTSWTFNSQHLVDAFEHAGYRVLNANQLKTWMNNRIADRKLSVVVFCQDVAPDTVVESKSPSCTLRRYLDAGGKIVWQADIPFYYQGHSNGSSTTWGTGGSIAILGFDVSSGEWDTGTEVTLTPDGVAWGLTETWRSYRPVASGRLRVLARDGKGNAAAWVKYYLPGDNYRGFVRIFDRNGEPNFNDLRRVAEYTGMKESNPTPSAGLRGEYYQWSGNSPPSHSAAFSSLVTTRIDPQINFNWGYGSPHPLVGSDNFSVRWTGKVEAAFTETYTFYTTTDDGVRLWVDGQQIINKWREQSATEWSGTIDLIGGQKYDIVMEMYENRVDAVAELRWSSPRTPKQLVPQAALSITVEPTPVQPIPVPSKYGGGTGEPDDPYLIYTGQQMNAIGANTEDWDKHFKLMADIDLSAFTGTDYNIIGYYVSWYDKEPFTGVFDGSGHTISNFSYTSADANGIGLFSYIHGENARIKDLGLIDPNVNGGTGTLVGSLAGFNNGKIRNCYAEGAIVSGNKEVGGLVGVNFGLLDTCNSAGNVTGNKWIGGLAGDNYGTITKCYSGCMVLGNSNVAGLTGYNNGTIKSCYATGIVTGSNDFTGGLVGYNIGGLVGWNNGVVSDCYSASSVSGDSLMGGLVGLNIDTVTRCYSAGDVTGRLSVGGLVGSNRETVTHSFWDIQTSGRTTSDGGAGKTTAEMQTASTFMNEGWDFLDQPDGPHDIWAESIDDGYPILCWQLPNRSGLPTFSGGTGEPDEPYLISTAEDLNRIGHNPRLMEEHFKLIDDIDLSGIDFFIIGSELYPFGGVFEGNGKKISNFTCTSADEDFIGLFRYVEGAMITDLGLIDSNVNAGTGSDVGALVGSIGYGDIRDCHVRNGNVSGYSRVGGLAGNNYAANITDCYNEGTVSGEKIIGGLVGTNHSGTIENCSSVSTVNGVEMVGGLAGMNDFSQLQGFYQPGIIAKCYATGSITGQMCVGGLVGDNLGNITDSYARADIAGFGRVGGLVGHNILWADENVVPPAISSCYASGSVFGMYMAGGLLGTNEGGTVTESFWDIETSGKITSDGGMGKTTSQMQMKSTFINAGWDFVDETANGTEDVWWILEGHDYPRLNWELIEDEPEDEPNEITDSLSEAMDTHLSFTTGGNADWFSQTTTSRYDGDAAQSPDISNNQESWMQTTVSGTGTVKFYWKVSSEEDFDFLEFYIDGSLQEKISGSDGDWEWKTYTISASGSHTLEWRYMKDGSGKEGSDCGWVDKVEWVTTP